MTDLTVRIAANEEELIPLLRLRYEVYVEAQSKRLPAIDPVLRVVRDEFDAVATHFYVSNQDGGLAACGRATLGAWPKWCEDAFTVPALRDIPRSRLYYISKVMVNPHNKTPDAVAKLFSAMYRDGRKRNAVLGLANCRPNLIRLYSRFGWRKFGQPFTDPYAGAQLPILIVAADSGYLSEIRSPLRHIAEEFVNPHEYKGWFERRFPASSSSKFCQGDETPRPCHDTGMRSPKGGSERW